MMRGLECVTVLARMLHAYGYHRVRCDETKAKAGHVHKCALRFAFFVTLSETSALA